MGVRARKTGKSNKLKRTTSRGALIVNAALASVAFIVGVWLYFYVERIPVAQQVQHVSISGKPGSDLIIGGLRAGPLLSINLQAGGRLHLSVDNGAKIISPTVNQLAAAGSGAAVSGIGARTILNIHKSGNGNAGLDLELRANEPMAVELVPVPTEDGRNGFHIAPRGGTLLVRALMIEGRDGSPAEMSLMSAAGTSFLDEASIEIPSGTMAKILADDPADGGERATVVELPYYSSDTPEETGILRAGSVAVRDSNTKNYGSVICAAARRGEKRLWPPMFPAVNSLDCVPGALALSAFNPFEEVGFKAAGNAFVVRDGKTEYWKGPAIVIANPFVAELLHKSIIPAVIAWLGLSFRALWKRRRRSR